MTKEMLQLLGTSLLKVLHIMESKLDRSKSSLKVNKKLRSERTTHSLLIAKGILVIVPDCVKSLV